ncbi:MAG: alpha/beta hydrolase [Proteobacteria bacterium]|nr:alpha/beta hydrolase [Pseudomonadota bacterium]
MRIAEADATQGKGPVVLFLHGWPESWYSWRHQIMALANAGYRVIAPDMPGFGGTDRLPRMEDYNIITIAGYIVGLLDSIEEQSVGLIGHDWGAVISWDLVKLYPARFSRLVALSVPYRPYPEIPPMVAARKALGDRFFYQLYFQTPNIPEAELDADPAGILSRLYCSPDTKRFEPKVTDKHMDAGGWIHRMGEPKESPSWFTAEDLNYYVNEFSRAGFSGGINYYRNIDRNWELMAPYADQTIEIPALFMAGDKDFVIGRATREELMTSMIKGVPNLKDVVILPGIGHWIQQEAPEQVNKAILGFLQETI